MAKYLFMLIAAVLAFSACDGDRSSNPSEGSKLFPERYGEKGLALVEGSSDKLKLAEKMDVVLSYDYLIGMHEVTCGDYGEVSCDGENFPITDVTFYDAVLFANKKSKAEKFDTVYTYSSAKFDSKNHCIYLENLSADLDRAGYRLPTEAEWIKAASVNWNSNNSWNAGNSDGKPHAVCSKKKDDSEWCDFEGNVAEWVSDWMAPVQKGSFNNFIGPAKPNTLGERMIKGGCFNSDAQAISLFSRKDTYTINSSSKANYIGFRLAFGKIPNAETMDVSNPQKQRIIKLATSEDVRNVAGTIVAKLAFRNEVSGNLVYVSYSDASLSMFEIQDDLDVYHPDISPDGGWVAFCTGAEGLDVNSSLYVRRLDSAGSKLVRLDVEGAAIPRWSVDANGDTVITYVTSAKNNKETEEWKKTSTWQVSFANGSFGTPKKLFDGSYHGGISENASLAVSGSSLLRARKAKSQSTVFENNAVDDVWYNGEQACNVSLVRDSTLRTAFLDFAGKTGKEFAGKSYAVHQRILIADKDGKLIQSIGAPDGYTFDHTEWASDGKISNIVATLVNGNGAHEKIVLVDVNNSKVVDLVQGEELWHPCLWVRHVQDGSSSSENKDSDLIKFDLDLDSAGVYYTPGGTELALKWRYKMELFWKYRNVMNTAVIGSSRSLHGVDPLLFSEGIKAMNLSVSNCDLFCTKYVLDNYILLHMKNLKYVVFSLDLDLTFVSFPSSYFEAHRSLSPGFSYDENHNYWKDGVPEQLAQRTYESLGHSQFEMYRETLGFHPLEGRGWGEPFVEFDSTWITKRRYLYDANFEALTEFIAECHKRDVIVVGVIFPENPLYSTTGSYAVHAMQRSVVPSLIQEIEDLSKTYPNFVLMDENKMGYHDYTDEMAYDHNHLSVAGATQITARIDSVLAKMAK